MSLLKRFLSVALNAGPGGAAPPTDEAETESVQRIAARLESLGPKEARYVAAFAYVLARVAHADLELEETEIESIESAVAELGGLPADEARLVGEIACEQSERLGGSENYVVTREFRRISTRVQRGQLLECLFALAAADGEIATTESHEVLSIADELGFTRAEALGVRASFREHVAELKPR